MFTYRTQRFRAGNRLVFLILIYALFHFNLLAQSSKKDSLLIEAKTIETDTARYQFWYDEALKNLYSDFDLGLYCAEQSAEVARELEDDIRLARSLSAMGIASIYRSYYSEAEAYLTESLILFKQNDQLKEVSHGLSRLGVLYLNQSKYEEAELNFNESIGICREIGDSLGVARNFLNLGLIYNYKGDPETTGDYYMRSLKIGEQAGDLKTTSYARNNFGSLLFDQGRFEDARDVYLECIEDGKQLNDNLLLADCYYMLSRIFKELRSFDDAREYGKLGIGIDEKQNNPRGLCMKWVTMGEIELADSNVQQALTNFQRSLDYALQSENHLQVLPASLVKIGEVERLLKNFDSAEKNLIEAIDAANKSELREYLVTAYQELAKTYSAQGKHDLAYEAHLNYSQQKDSLVNTKNNEHINRLEAVYQSEKKDNEILQLNAKNQVSEARAKQQNQLFIGSLIILLVVVISAVALFRANRQKQRLNDQLSVQKSAIEEKNEKIEQSLKEKEALLREIHHRVKNNLQVISSLLNLQSSSLSNEVALDAIKEGQNRVKSIALIHQKLYQTEDLSKVNFKEYADQLISHLASAMQPKGKSIETEVMADGIELDIDTAVPLGLIINELVTNSYKYAFANQDIGHIHIKLLRNDGDYQLRYHDNGIGFPEGFDLKKSKSLGMKLISILTRQLRGNIEWKNDKGALVNIQFKEAIQMRKSA